MRRRIDPELTRRARELRNHPTPTELAIWHRIARFRLAFTRQLVVAPFIIDLANPDGATEFILSEAAECLGGTHPQPLPCREGRARRTRSR